MIGFFVLLIWLVLPGAIVLDFFKLKKNFEFLTYSILFSICFLGFFSYFVSIFLPMSLEIYSVLAVLFLIIFFVRSFEDLKKIKLKNFKFENKSAFFILFLILNIFSGIIGLTTPDLHYDSLSYHLPLAKMFSENGSFVHFENPMNAYEIVVNLYPHLFEVIVGSIWLLTNELIANLVPSLIFLLCSLMIYFLSCELGKKSWIPSLLFVLSPQIFHISYLFLSDIFLALLFLSGLLFIFKFNKTKDKNLIFLASFFIALLLLVKFRGIPFAFLLILFNYYLNSEKIKNAIIMLVTLLLFSIPFYFKRIFGLTKVYKKFQPLVEESFFDKAIILSSRLLKVFFVDYFFLVIVALVFSFFQKLPEKLVKLRNLALVSFFGFILFMIFSNYESSVFPSSYRYFLPIFSLFCIIAGYSIELVLDNFPKKIILKSILLGLILAFIIPIFSVGFDTMLNINSYYESSYLAKIYENIPNNKNTVVFFANSFNPIVYNIEKTVIRDAFSFEFNQPSCKFLKEKKITHVIFFNSGRILTNFDENNFLTNLSEEINNKECGKILYEEKGWITILSLTSN